MTTEVDWKRNMDALRTKLAMVNARAEPTGVELWSLRLEKRLVELELRVLSLELELAALRKGEAQ